MTVLFKIRMDWLHSNPSASHPPQSLGPSPQLHDHRFVSTSIDCRDIYRMTTSELEGGSGWAVGWMLQPHGSYTVLQYYVSGTLAALFRVRLHSNLPPYDGARRCYWPSPCSHFQQKDILLLCGVCRMLTYARRCCNFFLKRVIIVTEELNWIFFCNWLSSCVYSTLNEEFYWIIILFID